MKYTYFDITDDTVFEVLKLQRNPFIRDKYLNKIFPIHINNMPNLKKGDIIELIKKHPNKTTKTENFEIEEYSYSEEHEVIIKYISKNGDVYVQYFNWYDTSFLGEVKRFFKRLKNKLLLKDVYTYTEKDSYDLNESIILVDELEKGLGLR